MWYTNPLIKGFFITFMKNINNFVRILAIVWGVIAVSAIGWYVWKSFVPEHVELESLRVGVVLPNPAELSALLLFAKEEGIFV